MAYTIEQANALLSDINTEVELRNLISQLDVTATGSVTILYSGLIGNGVHSTDVVNSMLVNGEDIRVLDKTEAARFLDIDRNTTLASTLERIFGTKPGEAGSTANQFLYGSLDADGNRIPSGAWDDISSRFVSATTGDVRTLAPFSDSSRVLAQTELSALLDNPAVSSIDGIPRDYYLAMKADALAEGLSEADAMNRVHATVSAISLDKTAMLQFVLDADGNLARNALGGLEAVGTRYFFADTAIAGTALPDGAASTFGGNVMAGALEAGTIPTAQIESLDAARAGIERLKQYAALDNAGHLLNKLGVIGDVIGLALASTAANAAYAQGDTARAGQIMTDWAAEFAGGLAGGIAAAQLMSSALAPLYLTGPAGAMFAGALTLMAGLAGGIVGGEALSSFIDTLRSLFNSAEATGSPLTLDLDGDGVETVAKTAGIHFDHDGNGFAELTGWAGADDGLLVWDRDGNGQITSGAELFGNNTVLADGGKAANGFLALAELDSDGDGDVDAGDAAFASLRVWKDADQDGLTDAGELLTLDEVGVQGLNTGYTNSASVDANGNAHAQVGSFVRTDGGTATMTDVWFAQDLARTVEVELIEVPEAIAALPEVQGFGNVHSLHQAMARDGSGALKGLVEQYAGEKDSAARSTLLDKIIYEWAGVSNVSTTSRGSYIDGRKVAALEAFLGELFRDSGSSTLGSAAATRMNDAWALLKESVGAGMMMQTHFRHYLDEARFGWDEATGSVVLELSGLASLFAAAYAADGVSAMDLIGEFVVTLRKQPVGSAVSWDVFEQAMYEEGVALGQAVTLAGTGAKLGGDGDDVMTGGSSDDLIMGFGGDDTITAGGGSDTIYGGEGQDIIESGGGTDTVYGGAGHDTVTVSAGSYNFVDGGDGNDTVWVSRSTSSNILMGGTGDDVLRADQSDPRNSARYNQGASTFTGGAGNDRLEGSGAADTYVYNRGDGQDAINDRGYSSFNRSDRLVFGEGIGVSDLSVSRFGGDIVIEVNDPADPLATDQITVENWVSDGTYRIEQLEFADGTVLGIEDIHVLVMEGMASEGDDIIEGWDDPLTIDGLGGNDIITAGEGNNVVHGGSGDDTITAGGGSDILDGGAGNDYLEGGAGNDLYLFGRGDGQDAIADYDPTGGNADLLSFGSGIEADQLWFVRAGSHLEVSIIGTGDVATVNNWYSGSAYRVEQFQTADGRTLLDSQVDNLVSAMAAFAAPPAGETTLPQSYQDALAPVIAANWQ